MFGGIYTTVMDSASCHNRDICTLTDIKIIVNAFLHSTLTQKNRNVYTLVDRSRFDDNVDSILISLCYNINICSCISSEFGSVGTNVIGTPPGSRAVLPPALINFSVLNPFFILTSSYSYITACWSVSHRPLLYEAVPEVLLPWFRCLNLSVLRSPRSYLQCLKYAPDVK